jgi:hypothetical protein
MLPTIMRPSEWDASILCMTGASGVRIGWADLPLDVRGAVEAIVGDTVVEAVSQTGGFSPGTADPTATARCGDGV